MWAVLGVAGGLVGVRAGQLVERFGMRPVLRMTLALLAASQLVLLATPSLGLALVSAAAFGIGFTVAFAVVVMWSQEVFADRPTDGFTVTIVFLALGFSVGPAAFGLLATGAGRPAALLATAAPALLALLLPPSARDSRGH